MNIIDKIQKLIALATNNPNAEESRCAAVRACELIKEHQIALVQEAPTANRPQAPHVSARPPSPYANYWSQWEWQQQAQATQSEQHLSFWEILKQAQERAEAERRARETAPSAK